MTVQAVTQARNLARAYKKKYNEILSAVEAIPTITVPDPSVPVSEINKFAYTFTVMSDADLKVGYSSDLATYNREDQPRALGSLINFTRSDERQTLNRAVVILNTNLPTNGMLCALLHSLGWLFQNENTQASASEQEYYEIPLTLYKLYDDDECSADKTLLDLNMAAMFAMFVMMPDDDLLRQMMALKTIDNLAAHYDLPKAAIKTRLMLGIHVGNANEN